MEDGQAMMRMVFAVSLRVAHGTFTYRLVSP